MSIIAKGNLLLHCILPSTWGNQRGELPLCIKQISGTVAADSSLQDRGVAHYLLSLLFTIVSLPFCFYFCVPNQKIPKIPASTMGSYENTKLCDFTSHNNSDFICTPIAPPASSAPSYEIKPALLNLVMKDQFSGAREDVALHLNNFIELCDMQKYKEVDGDIVKLKFFLSP